MPSLGFIALCLASHRPTRLSRFFNQKPYLADETRVGRQSTPRRNMKKICQALIAFCGSDACVESYLSRLLEFYCNWCRVGFVLSVRRPRTVATGHRIAGPSLVHDQLLSHVFINFIYPLAEAPYVVFLLNRNYCEFDCSTRACQTQPRSSKFPGSKRY